MRAQAVQTPAHFFSVAPRIPELEGRIGAEKGANEALREKIFKNMSQRAAEMLREEMGLAGQVRMKAVEEAQQRIIDIIKKLEDEDQVTINRGGTEDAFV